MTVKKVVCIEIGSHTLRVAEISGNSSGFQLHAASLFPLPKGTMKDGAIIDEEKLSKCIGDKLNKLGIRSKKVIFSIVSNKIMYRNVRIPYVKKQQVDSVIRLHADDYFPMGLGGQAVSYIIISEDKKEDYIEAMVYAAPEELISGYYSLAESLNLEIKSLDYYGNSIIQWMKEALEDRSVMLIRIGYNSSQATIMTNSTMKMQRSINYGINDIVDAAIEAGISKDRKKALELMCRKRYLLAHLDEETKNDTMREITDAARNMVGNFTRFVDYFYSKRKDSSDSIEQVIAIDVGEDIKGLPELISNELGIKLIRLDDIDPLVDFKYVEGGDSWKFLVAVGSTKNPVGFVTASILEERTKRSQQEYYTKGLKGIALICIVTILFTGVRYRMALSEHNRLLKYINRQNFISSVENDEIRAKEENSKIKSISQLTKESNECLPKLLSDLENQLPKTTIINSMSSAEDILTLSLSVDSKETAAEAITRLRSLKYLTSINVSSMTDKIDGVTGARQISFTLTAVYAGNISEKRGENNNSSNSNESDEGITEIKDE